MRTFKMLLTILNWSFKFWYYSSFLLSLVNISDPDEEQTQALNQIVFWFLAKFTQSKSQIWNIWRKQPCSIQLPLSLTENRQKTTENWVFRDNKRRLFSHLNIYWSYVASVCRSALCVVRLVTGRLELLFGVCLWPGRLFICSLHMNVCVCVCLDACVCVILTLLWQDEMGQKVLVDRRIVFTPKALLKM